ncbi:hypothetical protein BH10ACT11_BH10ACT11_18740 [soil metagenome]
MSQLSTLKSWTFLGVALALLLALACWIAAGSAFAGKGSQTAQQIGRTKHTPPPDCPTSKRLGNCGAIGKITAIQTRADGKNFPTRVLRDGKIVAYSIDLGHPTGHDRKILGSDAYFGSKHFGGASTARLSVLKRRGGTKFKLKRQSPTVVLNKTTLGHRFYLTLDRPLRVTKGLYVGLTIPTWITNIQGRFPSCGKPAQCPDRIPAGFSKNGNTWLGSRPADNCAALQPGAKSQQKVGSVKKYGCKYTQARVLYKAYYVPKKKKGNSASAKPRALGSPSATSAGSTPTESDSGGVSLP